jgi:predicted DNA-binding transcriptional regulator YafY
MRASRLLRLLLLLQNRGRLTCATLARELEVTRRTVLRDVDALTEAGLPIIVLRGPQGGIELGFNYRTRLVGLAADEAEALAVILAQPLDLLGDLGMRDAAARAIAKLAESFPDRVRDTLQETWGRLRFDPLPPRAPDERIPALADAIRERRKVTIAANTSAARIVHPVALSYGAHGWAVVDALDERNPVPVASCGDLSISARRF